MDRLTKTCMSDVLTGNPHLPDHWYVVAEGADLGATPLAVTLLGQDYVVWRSPTGPSSPPPTAARTARRRCRSATSRAAASCARTTAGRSATPAAASPCRQRRPACPCRRRPTSRPSAPPSATASCGCVPARRRGRSRRWPYEDDPAYRRINSGVERWTTSALRMTDNFLDIAHFPYVHAGTFGIAASTECRSSRSWRSTTSSPATPTRSRSPTTPGRRRRGSPAAVITRRMTTGFHLPFTVRSTIHYETGLDHIILLCTTPVDDVRVVLHVRRLAQRRPRRAGRGRHRLRPGDRRRGQADAGAGAGRPAARRSRARSACRPTGRASSGAAASPPCSPPDVPSECLPHRSASCGGHPHEALACTKHSDGTAVTASAPVRSEHG